MPASAARRFYDSGKIPPSRRGLAEGNPLRLDWALRRANRLGNRVLGAASVPGKKLVEVLVPAL
jgi:hypothetical protein